MSEATFLVGDVFERMAGIPDGSIDCIVTSPPFLALRSYLPADHPDKALEIGSEATPAAFLSTLLRLTDEWRRVLAPHGSIAVELGDTYSGSGGAGGDYDANGLRADQPKFAGSMKHARTHDPAIGPPINRVSGTKGPIPTSGPGWPLAKSLCGIPDAYALSLEYGWNMLNPTERCERWRVRNKIVWHRPNPPVGALGDKVRPSTSYITVACVSKDRWFDLDSERTAPSANTHARTAKGVDSLPRNGKSADRDGNWASLPELHDTAGAPLLDCWTIPTQPYSGAHYATFPSELPRRLINLMCPMHVCRTCGEPRRRIVDAERVTDGNFNRAHAIAKSETNGRTFASNADTTYTTLGWSDCGHDNYRRGITLDPFAGSGTTLAVATGLGRDAIGIDLDSRNLDLARERIGMFLQEEVVA